MIDRKSILTIAIKLFILNDQVTWFLALILNEI